MLDGSPIDPTDAIVVGVNHAARQLGGLVARIFQVAAETAVPRKKNSVAAYTSVSEYPDMLAAIARSQAVMNCGDMLTTTIENEPQWAGWWAERGSGGVASGLFFFWPWRCLAGRRLTIERRIYHDLS